MDVRTRVKRAVKEVLGLHQWPIKSVVQPRDFEEQIYSALLQEGDVCFDIGASHGGVALYLARLAGPTGHVVAFEPVPPAYFELCGQIQKDGHEKAAVVTIPMGLSDRIGTATICVPGKQFGFGSLAAQAGWGKASAPTDISTFECSFTTLDSVLRNGNYPRPDFIKIDVEGAELLVLRGGAAAFDSGFRPLMLIELFAPWEKSFGYGPWDVLSHLANHGYRFLFACSEGLVEHLPSRAAPFPPEYEKGYNVVAFIPAKHGDRISRAQNLCVGTSHIVLSMPPPPLPNRIE